MINNNPLNDINFLNNLFSSNEHDIYVKITALNFNEQPLESIEGKATDGSIKVDGTSAVRRTCNITMIAENINITEFYWGLKNKFKLEIGLKNFINSNYPDIIWFKQGIYVITQFSTTQNTKKWTIKISGKDKMCLLNGDISGNLPFNVDFAREQYYDKETKTTIFKEVPLKTILQKALIEFGKESIHNIIIKDMDDIGQEILEYRGIKPMYLFKDQETKEFKQINIDEQLKCYYELKNEITEKQYNAIPQEYFFLKEIYQYTSIGTYRFNYEIAKDNMNYQTKNHNGWFEGKISDDFFIVYDDLLDDTEFEGNLQATFIRFNLHDKFINKRYTVAKIETGDIPGYQLVELTYGGELKASIGESITSILDKIKNKFVNFEYFYDIDGKFIFQKKIEYLSTSWNQEDEQNKILSINNNSNILFNFIDGKLITSFQNTPKFTELKNDYSVWGAKDNTTLHMRFAIDNKPIEYTPIRPLKEKTVYLFRDLNGNKIKEKIISKYYDAPEIEPYNEEGLFSNDFGYQFVNLMDQISNKNRITLQNYKNIVNILNNYPDDILINQWLNLFVKDEKSSYFYKFLGTNEDIKNIFIKFNSNINIYDNYSETSIINEKEQEIWIVTYFYYAKYPYGVNNIYDENNNIIHYKVDWRELIYQMALDYRKLNYTDNFAYNLKLANPEIINGKTGYEQYYIDLEGFWRQLYNPNPTLLFSEPIPYSEIKKETLLLDNIEDNDILDKFYIQNPYVIIDENNLENINFSNIYIYNTPKFTDKDNIKPIKNSLYLFLKSKECCLEQTTKENSNIYYIEKTDPNGNLIMDDFTWYGEESEDNYNVLNTTSFEKIYIKNDENFDSKIFNFELPYFFQKNLFYTRTGNKYELAEIYEPKKTYYKINNNGYYTVINLKGHIKDEYKPGLFYIKNNNNNYIISLNDYDENTIYYRINNANSYENFIDKNNINFNTLIYSATSGLHDYKDEQIKDYILYYEKKFKELKDNFSNKDFKYYTKESINEKLSNIFYANKKLWNLYYSSDLYPLSYYTIDILQSLMKLNEAINLNEIKEFDIIGYVDSILTIFNNYITKLINKDFKDIKIIFTKLLYSLFQEYQSQLNILLSQNYKQDETCLYYLLDFYKKEINKFYSKFEIDYLNTPLNKSQFSFLINLIDNQKYNDKQTYEDLFILYDNFWIFNGDIIAKNELTNLIQIKIEEKYSQDEQLSEKITLIKNINNQIKNLIINIKDNYQQVKAVIDKKQTIEQVETIEDLQKILTSLVSTLNLKQGYTEGQLQKTINAIESLILDIDKNENSLENYKLNFKDIVFHIENLDIFLKNIPEIIFKNIFILSNTKITPYSIIIDFLNKISLLYTIFEIKNINTFDEYKKDIYYILLFNEKILISDLEEKINNALTLEDLTSMIKQYEKSSSNFQEYIFKYDVNNFGYITDKPLIYEPIKYYKGFYNYNHDKIQGNFWSLDIYTTPQNLYFWFDFLEPSSSELAKYSVPVIGSRTKVINDKDVKAVHYKEIPNIIFKKSSQEINNLIGYTYINITDSFMNLFSVSSRSKTAKERIDELLLNHSYCVENINISTIPIYHLQPNNFIYIRDDKSNIEGKYSIKNITIPLNYKKTMTINALKTIDDII